MNVSTSIAVNTTVSNSVNASTKANVVAIKPTTISSPLLSFPGLIGNQNYPNTIQAFLENLSLKPIVNTGFNIERLLELISTTLLPQPNTVKQNYDLLSLSQLETINLTLNDSQRASLHTSERLLAQHQEFTINTLIQETGNLLKNALNSLSQTNHNKTPPFIEDLSTLTKSSTQLQPLNNLISIPITNRQTVLEKSTQQPKQFESTKPRPLPLEERSNKNKRHSKREGSSLKNAAKKLLKDLKNITWSLIKAITR